MAKIGRMVAMEAASARAAVIEQMVRSNYCDKDTDAADLAMVEILEHPGRSNDEIARAVAQRLLQP